MTTNKTTNQRSVRLNKVVCNEFNSVLHTVFKEETSKITVTHVSVSPDMHDAYVYFSVVGTEADIENAKKFLKKNSNIIRQRVFQRVQIKFSPRLTFRYDPSIERGHHILEILDELEKVVSSPNFVKLLTRYKEYNVVGHIRPDGDCVGSQLAIANILKQLGIKCNIIKNSDIGRVLSRFFDGYELINDNEMDMLLPLICVDCSDFRRTGDYISENYKTSPYICIDHHTSNDRFAENNIINTSAAATAEIIADLMLQNGIKFSREISNLLYLGIMTDTNRFAYETTTKNTLRIVEHLVDNGANLSSIYYDVYEHDSIERYRALETFLKNICVFANGKCCISHLTFDDLEKAGAKHSDTEGFVNYARQLDGVDIGAFLEFNKDYINCSMRAKSPKFRIDTFAEKFGGGGHPAAAGFVLKNFQKNFYETFKLELANYVQSFYENDNGER